MYCYLPVFLGLFEPFRRDLTRMSIIYVAGGVDLWTRDSWNRGPVGCGQNDAENAMQKTVD